MKEQNATAAAGKRPAPLRMTASAAAYLAELDAAVTLTVQRRSQAELAADGEWLMTPTGAKTDALTGSGGALFSPLLHVDAYRAAWAHQAVEQARTNVARAAWWYATAAVTALQGVLSGQEVTARMLEKTTLHLPGRAEQTATVTTPWAACYRADLPEPDVLRTGIAHLDDAMDQALEPLRAAYAAAVIAEDLLQQDAVSEEEATELTEAGDLAEDIPNLLIGYARTVVQAAHGAN